MSEDKANTSSSNKVKIEAVILIVLLITAVALGIPAYQSYTQLEKAIAVFQEGDECLHNNDVKGAKAKFTECIKIHPQLRGAYEELAAIALFEEKDLDQACKIYDEALVAIPNNSDLYVSYAQMMFTVQNYEKARDLAKKAVEIDANNPLATSHYDLFERMTKDPELRKNHQDIINKQGGARASIMPGAHHHVGPEGDADHAHGAPGLVPAAVSNPAQPASPNAAPSAPAETSSAAPQAVPAQ